MTETTMKTGRWRLRVFQGDHVGTPHGQWTSGGGIVEPTPFYKAVILGKLLLDIPGFFTQQAALRHFQAQVMAGPEHSHLVVLLDWEG